MRTTLKRLWRLRARYVSPFQLYLFLIVVFLFTTGLLHIERTDPTAEREYVLSVQDLFNERSAVLNELKFKDQLRPGHIPIVTYVYKRPEYFRQVIDALRRVDGIEETILVVSHDSLDRRMFDLVGSIDFCMVKELIHPRLPSQPSNARALKDHWWWLLRHLWLTLWPKYDGDVVFIEEDHVVSPDFYRLLQLLSRLKMKGFHPELTTLALGSEETAFGGVHNEFKLFTGFMNTGYAFNRTVFTAIKRNFDEFDVYDDDWDCSLADLMRRGRLGHKQLSPLLSRIVNIGAEGIHKTQSLYDLYIQGKYPVATKGPPPTWDNVTIWDWDPKPPTVICSGLQPCLGRPAREQQPRLGGRGGLDPRTLPRTDPLAAEAEGQLRAAKQPFGAGRPPPRSVTPAAPPALPMDKLPAEIPAPAAVLRDERRRQGSVDRDPDLDLAGSAPTQDSPPPVARSEPAADARDATGPRRDRSQDQQRSDDEPGARPLSSEPSQDTPIDTKRSPDAAANDAAVRDGLVDTRTAGSTESSGARRGQPATAADRSPRREADRSEPPLRVDSPPDPLSNGRLEAAVFNRSSVVPKRGADIPVAR